MDQIAVRAVDLDAVEAGRDRVAGRGGEVRDGRGDLVLGQFPRGDELLQAVAGEDLAGQPHRGRADGMRSPGSRLG